MMSSKPLVILLADDDPDDRALAFDAFSEGGIVHDLRSVGDGEELLEYLRREKRYAPPALAPKPGLVLLDINMPRMNGLETLEILKADPDLKSIPVVVLSTSRAPGDVKRSYDLGANSYVTKPFAFNDLVDVLGKLDDYWLNTATPAPR
jgi:two-component system response regulator